MSAPSTSSSKKRRKRGGLQQPPQPPLTEAARYQIRRTLQHFRQSDAAEEYAFEASLSNVERAEVHKLCRRMGMTSKSYGGGNQRRVSVYKLTGNWEKTKGKLKKTKGKLKKTKPVKDLTSFTFSEESKVVLRDFFSLYPPGDHGEGENIIATSSTVTNKKQTWTDDILWKPSMKKTDIAKKLESVVARMESDLKLKQITEERSKLPIASFKDVITSTIEAHQVVLISGETGCGKTTQVPQYLLDYMWSKGDACKVICTQPRRISAMSVAERISSERGEMIGESVGYKKNADCSFWMPSLLHNCLNESQLATCKLH